MKQKFDIQFFGGGGSSATQYRKRDPEPAALTGIENQLADIFGGSLSAFTGEEWEQQKQNAKALADKATGIQGGLLDNISPLLNKNGEIVDSMLNVTNTGNLPSQFVDSLNASVNKNLQSNMGSMLSGLGSRGVLNSSITSKGINNLAGNAADAYNQNFLNAYNSIINGYSSALTGSQNNLSNTLSSIGTLGQIPTQAYENLYAGITPAYNMWKDWKSILRSGEDYDTVVKEGK